MGCRLLFDCDVFGCLDSNRSEAYYPIRPFSSLTLLSFSSRYYYFLFLLIFPPYLLLPAPFHRFYYTFTTLHCSRCCNTLAS